MGRCRVCWTPPPSHRRSCRWNRLALVPTPGSVRFQEVFDTPTGSRPPRHQDTPTTGRSPHTSTPSSSFVYSETQKRGSPSSSSCILKYFKDILYHFKGLNMIVFPLFSFRPSATTLIGHPFFKQVCKIPAQRWRCHCFSPLAQQKHLLRLVV